MASPGQFLIYLAGFFYRPRWAIRDLKGNKSAVTYGIWAILAISVLYSVTSALLYFSDLKCCWAQPFLNVPEEKYWLVQIIWELPLMFLFAALPSALIELLSHASNKESHFKQLFASMGFTVITVQLLNMWLPETLMALTNSQFLPPIINSIRVYIFVPWALLLTTLTTREIKGLGWLHSLAISFIAFMPNVVIALAVIR